MRSSRKGARAPVTQREVAERAGVSVRTVSNVVNGFAYVSDTMRAKVQRALDELGYRPNLIARSLNRGRSGMIALVLPFDVVYFSELARELGAEAERHGLVALIDRTEGKAEREREFVVRTDRAVLFDGAIFSPIGMESDEFRRRETTMPIVLLGEKHLAGPFDRVAIDDQDAARAATSHLIDIGRRRVAAIGAVRNAPGQTWRHRVDGYRQALRDKGKRYDRRLVMEVSRFTRENGAASMARLLDLSEPPDAVFCFNDLLAAGAMRVIADRGLRVPEDIAIAGFDDVEESRYCVPTLTTVSPSKAEIAKQAVDLLVRRIDGDAAPPETRLVPWTLLARESTIGRGARETVVARSSERPGPSTSAPG